MVEGTENKGAQKTNSHVKLTTWTCLLNTGAQLSDFSKGAKNPRFLKFCKRKKMANFAMDYIFSTSLPTCVSVS